MTTLLEHFGIAILAAFIWWLQRDTSRKIQEVHVLVNSQRDRLIEEIASLKAEIIALRGRQ